MSKYIYKVSDSYFIKNNNGSMKIWSTGQSVGDNQSYTLSNITISGSLLASATTGYNYVNCGTNTASSSGSYTISIGDVNAGELYGTKPSDGLYYFVPYFAFIDTDIAEYVYFSGTDPTMTIVSGMNPAEVTQILCFNDGGIISVSGNTVTGPIWQEVDVNNQPI